MRLSLFLIIFPSLALAADMDLGIPSRSPWRRPGTEKARAQSQKSQRTPVPLEADFWPRLALALDSIERSRDGMLQALAYALGRPDAFPRRPAQRPSFEEYEETARRTWLRAADHWLVLESWVGVYRDFNSLPAD